MADYKFQFVAQLHDKEFLTVLDGKELVQLWEEGIITYNPVIQRGTRIRVNRSNEEVEEPVYSKTNVKKIYEAIVSGIYFEDMITLNVLADGDDRLNADLDSEDMMIHAVGDINIADGQHRIRALKMVADSNQRGNTNINLNELTFPVKITNYDVNNARMQFHQFAKGLKISSSRSEYFNTIDHSNEVVRVLMRNSELAGRVEVVRNVITKKEKRHVVTFATMVNAIKMVYGEMTNNQAQELSSYLTEFFGGLFNTIEEFLDFDRRQQSKEVSLKAENFAFYGYVAISRLLRNRENWQQYLPLINELNLAKDSEMWFGKVTKRGTSGFAIINSSDSRSYFIEEIENQFQELLENQ